MARLTDTHLRSLKPREKTYRIHDGEGLYAEITPKGRIIWRLRLYVRRADCKVNTFVTLGEYPILSLKGAREAAQSMRAMYRFPHTSPIKTTATFRTIAEDWLKSFAAANYDADYLRTIRQRLNRYILPKIGGLPIAGITTATLFNLLHPIAERIPETASRCRMILSSIFRFAVAQGLVERDVTAELRGQLPTARVEHFPAPTELSVIGQILRALWSYYASPQVQAALRLLPYLFVRSGELRLMRWEDIDFDQQVWRYTASKTNTPHIVPLSRQAIELLEGLPRLSHYVFASPRTPSRPLSENAIVVAYASIGLRGTIVPHSWRAIARTLLQEQLHFPPHIIELQLAHTVREPLGRAYNRTSFLAERREMMQRWADWLDELREMFNPME